MKIKNQLTPEAIFFREAKKHKQLNTHETIDFIKQGRYEEAVNGNISLAISVLQKCPYARMTGDNIGTAMIGLFKAVKNFNCVKYESNNTFSTYAVRVIKSYLLRTIYDERNIIHIPLNKIENKIVRESDYNVQQCLNVHYFEDVTGIDLGADKLIEEVDKKFVAERLYSIAEDIGTDKHKLYKMKVLEGQTLQNISYNYGSKNTCTKQYVGMEYGDLKKKIKGKVLKDFYYGIAFN